MATFKERLMNDENNETGNQKGEQEVIPDKRETGE